MEWKSFAIISALIIISLHIIALALLLSSGIFSYPQIIKFFSFLVLYPFVGAFTNCGVESATQLCTISLTIIFTLIQATIIWLIILGIYWLIRKIKQK